MTTDAFIKIIGSIFTILITLISIYVIPAVKATMTQKDIDTLRYYIPVAVRCADQIYTADECREKKAYVKKFIIDIIDKHLSVKLTEEDIDTLIEGAVNEIHDNGVSYF